MKQTRLLMGMPITVEIVDPQADSKIFDEIYDYFAYVDNKYSTYKDESEISRINAGLSSEQWSDEMKMVFELCEQTKQQTGGYFDIQQRGKLDPSGLVKGWAIQNAADILHKRGFRNFYVDAGGDIQVSGKNAEHKPWTIGIRNPSNREEVVKVISVASEGVATSGTYIRGQHVYNPHDSESTIEDVASITVIGPNIYDADRFATAAFAMGRSGIEFIESLDGYDGYMIDSDQRATLTSGFDKYVVAS